MGEITLQDVADRVDDLARVVARQGVTLGALADARAGSGADTGPDVPMLVELHALRVDALACAAPARSRGERDAFAAMATSLERLVVGRGGAVVVPAPGADFDARTMTAVEIAPTGDAAADRTVATVLEPGLSVGPRSVRPARVQVHRFRAPAEPRTSDAV